LNITINFFPLRSLEAQMGNVVTLSISRWMHSWNLAGGWPLIYYSTGMIGLILG
jgi:hypothetical protein